MNGYTITQLRRVNDGTRTYWAARVTPSGGQTINVDRRSGSWQMDHPTRPGWRKVLRTDIAADLQSRVRTIEGRERREAEAAQKREQVAA